MTAHSKLGASSAYRWINCPGSVKLSETVPAAPSSDYALQGTAAHELAEVCLLDGCNPRDLFEKGVPVTKNWDLIDEDMIEAVEVYVNYVRSRRGELSVETRFDLSHIEEGMFGTNDACVYDNMLGVLEVIDYKHGAGISVDPVENPQLAYYGIGAAKVYELHPNSTIKLTIVQPRASGEAIKSWTTTVDYLNKFAKVLKKAAKKTRTKDAELSEGSWCKFCPASAICPQLQKKSLEVAQAEFADDGAIILPQPESMDVIDIKKVLGFSDTLGSWLKAVETYAFNMLERGEKIDGYKLVKKRANRKWKFNEDQMVTELCKAVGLEDQHQLISNGFYSEPKLKSPAQLEKVVDKNLVASLCETPDNGNTMVHVSDKRPEVLPTIQSDFEPIEIQD